MRRTAAWLAVIALTSALTAATVVGALDRYRDFRTGWSWDLAYYNQWLWAIDNGDGILSVRPAAPYADEGPPVWKMNYLAPIRLALLPFHAAYPDPRTLLVIHAVVFWWVVPAAFTLVRSETGSDGLALLASALVPATPLLWPLAWNDFRELQMALPFVLWGVQGYRSRDLRLAAVGVTGMLACRQEFALVVATFGLIPPREPEDAGRTYAWAQRSMLLGLGWMFFGFFGYLKFFVGRHAPTLYVGQFTGPKATIAQSLETSADLLWYGMGPWALFAVLAPRVALLALPWVWSIASGRWALRLLGTEQWHHVRYVAPAAALVLAAGLVGFARSAGWLRGRRGGGLALAGLVGLAALGFAQANREVQARFDRVPVAIGPEEAAAIRAWIERVGPDDGVLAAYEVTAPLSSRRNLWSYRLTQNQPKGYPALGPEFRWAFVEHDVLPTETLTGQGFELVHSGPFLRIFRRPVRPG